MSNDREAALKPCPFCGGKGIWPTDKSRGQCLACGALGPFNYDPAKAIAHWNTRVPPASEPSEAMEEDHNVLYGTGEAAPSDGLDDIEPIYQGLRAYAQNRRLLVLSVADLRRAARAAIAALKAAE